MNGFLILKKLNYGIIFAKIFLLAGIANENSCLTLQTKYMTDTLGIFISVNTNCVDTYKASFEMIFINKDMIRYEDS